ncbi:MAG: HAMP domain-containing histidine kinase [Gammaproteobacteria bacterium]|nr:HAMP domain-containing histidine kinase [Gammaproteobacteria bacterium]
MSKLATHSLERYISLYLTIFSLILLIITDCLLYQLAWSFWNIVIISSALMMTMLMVGYSFRQTLLSAINRGLLHIEAIRLEDYNQYAKAEFKQGCVGEFHRELKVLSQQLQNQKSRYDQHAFLIYQLIDQLDTPILVFNQKNKLTYANGAFSQLYDQPWQMFRNSSPKLLGLIRQGNDWQLKERANQWQISQSEFIDTGEAHQLLVFINIESALRQSQLEAWQQIIRVMSHEIRNSLTPVSSLAESLSQRSNNTRDQQAFAVISERCNHLQDFINRYASLSHNLSLNCDFVDVNLMIARLGGLFDNNKLTCHTALTRLWADQIFLDQVLINLIKNAFEADSSQVSLAVVTKNQRVIITVEDNGHGFSNLDNLFVPLFTTKIQGQGIGLSFCRSIIEQHQGTISLTNNAEAGVTVTIKLPLH